MIKEGHALPESNLKSGFIINKAMELGASLAGIAAVCDLRESLSYKLYDQSPYYEGYTGVDWPEDAKSVLVLALFHDPSKPELDWWSEDIPGRTPGNRILMNISKHLKNWLTEEYQVKAKPLPYAIERGGIFLKDAAVLAGLGVIGENNLLITREYGPQIRLRALFLYKLLESTGSIEYSPCADCSKYCFQACPENAFRGGSYNVTLCEPEMHRNRTRLIPVGGEAVGIDSSCQVEKFCRACELSCPIGSELG